MNHCRKRIIRRNHRLIQGFRSVWYYDTFHSTYYRGRHQDGFKSNIKVVFGELIGNPGLDVVNIKEVTDFLHENGVPFIADATTATPYLVNALSLGADVVIHSSSKYINGSGNSISGIIVDGGKFKWDKDRYPAMKEYSKYGKFAYTARLRNDVWRNMGGCLAPMNAYFNNFRA